MKKLMTMLGVVALAVCAQAASVDWKVTSAYNGKTYYVFNGDVSSAAVAALSDTTGGGSAAFATWLGTQNASSYSTGTGTSRGKTGSFAGTAADSLTFLVLDSTMADGNQYGIQVVSTSGKTYTTGTPPGSVVIDESSFSVTANTIASAASPEPPPSGDVPEPTTGLLVLLGVAGLALRRRT